MNLLISLAKIIFVIALALILAVALAGCGMKEESSDEDIDTGFRVLEKYSSTNMNMLIVYDKTTGVMYLANYHGSVTPIINADGSPRIWEGEK